MFCVDTKIRAGYCIFSTQTEGPEGSSFCWQFGSRQKKRSISK